ncbi:hypothetical protein [Methylobacterium symbioticum]|jgi:hypothetical protein|uniref:Uncharacterized protein n=1 Tax=Methylobacterium symbioticum TaxID=2584084 RepID=A0A509EMT6_9HYPH|nr:hypothetical protein [Methylobacterium symbioticum]VUD74563.1 hypothetical protein MET9862_05195 [Methylobacterium symbioticum]
MTLLTALALLPVAAIANIAVAVALAGLFDGDARTTDSAGPVPTLA